MIFVCRDFSPGCWWSARDNDTGQGYHPYVGVWKSPAILGPARDAIQLGMRPRGQEEYKEVYIVRELSE